jgi:hypothetical protein
MPYDEDKYLKHRFPGQKEGEQIKALVRKHWIVALKVGFMFFAIGIIPTIIAITLVIAFWNGQFTDPFLYGVLAFFVYILAVMAFTYMAWINEELDVIIITNERVVAHDQVDIFHRQISETSIARIQDVKGVEKGVLGNLLHYGLLEIQTAARDIVFNIQHAKSPYGKARRILDIRDRYLDKEKFERRHEGSHNLGSYNSVTDEDESGNSSDPHSYPHHNEDTDSPVFHI